MTGAPAPEDLVRTVERCRRHAQRMFEQVRPLCGSRSAVLVPDPDAFAAASRIPRT
jgi:hypothetical protein